jgi:hypothetical protein
MISMTAVRRVALVLSVTAVLGACTPGQVALWRTLDPVSQRAVVASLQTTTTAPKPVDCYGAMERVFPPHTWAWGRKIIHRESTNNPAAANPRSSARGCWQLLSSLHADKYAKAGCHVSQWADAMCNTRAAYVLYQMAGTSPWSF